MESSSNHVIDISHLLQCQLTLSVRQSISYDAREVILHNLTKLFSPCSTDKSVYVAPFRQRSSWCIINPAMGEMHCMCPFSRVSSEHDHAYLAVAVPEECLWIPAEPISVTTYKSKWWCRHSRNHLINP